MSDAQAPASPAQQPQYDFERIQEYAREASAHDAGWRSWFARNDIEPHLVLYEELDEDPVAAARRVLDFLGLEMPPDCRIAARTRRLADDLNRDWKRRYLAAERPDRGQPI